MYMSPLWDMYRVVIALGMVVGFLFSILKVGGNHPLLKCNNHREMCTNPTMYGLVVFHKVNSVPALPSRFQPRSFPLVTPLLVTAYWGQPPSWLLTPSLSLGFWTLYKWNHSVNFCLCGFLYSISCLWDSSRLLFVIVYSHCFIVLYRYIIIFYPFSCWWAFAFFPDGVWIVLLWIFLYMSLEEHIHILGGECIY